MKAKLDKPVEIPVTPPSGDVAGSTQVNKASTVSAVHANDVDPSQGQIYGFARFGGPIGAANPKPRPEGVQEAADQIRDLAELAVRYAEAGKPRIAEDVMREARSHFDDLINKTGWSKPQAGVHQGLWKGGANLDPTQAEAMRLADKALDQAAKKIDAASSVQPVATAKKPYEKLVVLYGTSGNPPTFMGGHAGIASWAAKDLRIDLPNDEKPKNAVERAQADEVWVLPVYKHAFASKSNLQSWEHRLAMSKLGFENIPGLEGKVKVVETEREVIEAAVAKAEDPTKIRVGTVDIIRKLQADHPNIQFVLALGGDTYQDLQGGKWKEGDTLQQLLPIVVIPRAGVDGVNGTEDNAPKLSDVSSTKIRAAFETIRNQGEGLDEAWKLVQEALHPDVLQYILNNNLY